MTTEQANDEAGALPRTPLGHDPVLRLLIRYSVPAITATAAASLYNIIDRVFIGHGVGPMAISGLALTFPFMNLAAACGALVGVGAAALVSIRLGERDQAAANHILGNAIFLNLLIGTCFSGFGLLFLDRILAGMGASRATLPFARSFMQVILLGNVFQHMYLGLNSIMRASGRPHRAMGTTLLTVGVNLVLAPLFIFGFGWGIRGAALATVTAQIVGTLVAFLSFTRGHSQVAFIPTCLRPQARVIRDIFAIGMSSFVMLFCSSIVITLFNLRLERYGGDYAIGAFGIINAMTNLFVMIIIGVNMGMQPIAGFNFGARQYARVAEVFGWAVAIASGVATLGFLLGEVCPLAVARLFTHDPRLLVQAVRGMRLAFATFPVIGFQMVTSSYFQSMGRAKVSIFMALSRQVLFLIPFLLLLPPWLGLDGVWAAEPVADLVSFLVAFQFFRTQGRRFPVAE